MQSFMRLCRTTRKKWKASVNEIAKQPGTKQLALTLRTGRLALNQAGTSHADMSCRGDDQMVYDADPDMASCLDNGSCHDNILP